MKRWSFDFSTDFFLRFLIVVTKSNYILNNLVLQTVISASNHPYCVRIHPYFCRKKTGHPVCEKKTLIVPPCVGYKCKCTYIINMGRCFYNIGHCSQIKFDGLKRRRPPSARSRCRSRQEEQKLKRSIWNPKPSFNSTRPFLCIWVRACECVRECVRACVRVCVNVSYCVLVRVRVRVRLFAFFCPPVTTDQQRKGKVTKYDLNASVSNNSRFISERIRTKKLESLNRIK